MTIKQVIGHGITAFTVSALAAYVATMDRPPSLDAAARSALEARADVSPGRPARNHRGVSAPNPIAPSGETTATNPRKNREAAVEAAIDKETPPKRAYIKEIANSRAASVCTCDDCDCLNASICKDGNCEKAYIVAIGAKWCGPCHRMKPIYAELRKRGYAVYELDEAVHKGAMSVVKPKAFPCLIIHRNGGPVQRVYGTQTITFLEDQLNGKERQR